ncbi:anti-phage dCTP deaminase [Caenispirillum salinarum]|uniref:anti-phage dCTP deaminase n=1 Tax=Caenispirillum salinarum TaxID=859058 RepID=UPI00384D60BF
MAEVAYSAPTLVEDSDPARRARGVSPLAEELVIGLIGYAGSGCSSVADTLEAILVEMGYQPARVKLSNEIVKRSPGKPLVVPEKGTEEGIQKLKRARELQNLGDALRKNHGNHAVAALAIKEIVRIKKEDYPNKKKIAFILDSIKHSDEVDLLRRVYDRSFRLVAVHCERGRREERLIGDLKSKRKYRGAPPEDVKDYLDRDEKDKDNDHGQQVRDAFFLADYFLDNNLKTEDGLRIAADLERFANLLLGRELVRPTVEETGMFYADAAALQSACLSRQVGASLQTPDGRIVASGANEVPKFGGGVYAEGDKNDHRCFKWDWESPSGTFNGCHNARLKDDLRRKIAEWMGKSFSNDLAEIFLPHTQDSMFAHEKERLELSKKIYDFFVRNPDNFIKMPGIREIIEYSRSIHAEMNTLFNAARQGISPEGCTLYTTTFPCHNCARHLVTAGIKVVYYIEPFVKSLAKDLHHDAISTETPKDDAKKERGSMLVLPFTGVGPRMYRDYFLKTVPLKNDITGAFKHPDAGIPGYAVRLKELADVERAAAELVGE